MDYNTYENFVAYDFTANSSLSGLVTNNFGSQTDPEKTDAQIDKKKLAVVMTGSGAFSANRTSGFCLSMMVPVFQ